MSVDRCMLWYASASSVVLHSIARRYQRCCAVPGSRYWTSLTTTIPCFPSEVVLSTLSMEVASANNANVAKPSFDTWKSHHAVVVFHPKKLCLKCRCKRCPLLCLRLSIRSKALECMCILPLSESNTLVERQQCQTSIVSTYAVTTWRRRGRSMCRTDFENRLVQLRPHIEICVLHHSAYWQPPTKMRAVLFIWHRPKKPLKLMMRTKFIYLTKLMKQM